MSEDRKAQLLGGFDLGPGRQQDFTRLLPALADELYHFHSLAESGFYCFFKQNYTAYKVR